MIRWAGKNKFNVKDMNQNDFYDFNSLLKTKYKMLKKKYDRRKIYFSTGKMAKICETRKKYCFLQNDTQRNSRVFKIDMSRNKVLHNNNLPMAYNEELPITNEKKKDLLSLLPLIPEVFHQYYINLKTKKITDPILSDEEETS